MWRPHNMLPVAAGLRQVARSIESQAGPVRGAVVGLDRTTDWVGVSRNSADDRADEERKWLTNLSDNFEDVATAIEKACENIANHKSALDALQNGAADAGYELISASDTTWRLRTSEGRRERSGDAAAMTSWSTRLVAQANELFVAAQNAAASLHAQLGQLTTLTPAQLALSGTAGKRDARMAEDGWTPEELRAIGDRLQAAQLTPEQITALMNGETADVPPGVISYLRNLFKGLDPKDALALRYGLDDQERAAGQAFANGIHTLSNEKVAGGGTSGGFGELPGWLKGMATERVPVRPEDQQGFDAYARSFALGQLVSGATTQPGVRLGSELTQKTANLIEARRSLPASSRDLYMANPMTSSPWAQANGLRDPAHAGEYPDATAANQAVDARWQDTLESLLSSGTLNHESSTAVLTGHGGLDAGIQPGYDRDSTMRALSQYEWRDDGKALGNLTNWIDDYANDQTNSYRSELSAEAFRGMYDFTTKPENYSILMDTNGAQTASVGDINPEFVKSLEEATRPYLNVLSGGIPANHGFSTAATEHLRDFGGPEFDIAADREFRNQVTRLFSVIASGEGEGGAGQNLVRDIQIQQVANATELGSDNSAGAADLGSRSGWLQRLLRDGLTAAQYDNWEDQNPTKESMSAADFTSLKANVSTIVKEGLKDIPFVGRGVSVGAGMMIDWVQQPVATNPNAELPGAGAGSYPTEVSEGNPVLAQYLAAYQASNPTLPEDPLARQLFFDNHGNVRSLEDLLESNDPDDPLKGTEAHAPETIASILRQLVTQQGIDIESYNEFYGNSSGAGSGLSASDPTSEAVPSMSYDEYLLNIKGKK